MFNPKVPMFEASKQASVINAHAEDIAMISAARDIPEWNVFRHVIRASMPNRLEYFMLMGYIDNVVFPQTFNLKRNGRKV